VILTGNGPQNHWQITIERHFLENSSLKQFRSKLTHGDFSVIRPQTPFEVCPHDTYLRFLTGSTINQLVDVKIQRSRISSDQTYLLKDKWPFSFKITKMNRRSAANLENFILEAQNVRKYL
jgi:hypothetical protein